MTAHRSTVLLTGFGPFPGMPENATQMLVPELAARAELELPQQRTVYAILPTEWQAAPARLDELYDTHRPELAVHFGVAREARGFRVECQAMNVCQALPDACGEVPGSAMLMAGGPERYAVTFPAGEIAGHLTSLGLPAYVSEDAGSYLCNALLYHALTAASRGHAPSRAGFVHIPADLSGPPLTFNDAVRGGLEILKVCAASLPDAAPRA